MQPHEIEQKFKLLKLENQELKKKHAKELKILSESMKTKTDQMNTEMNSFIKQTTNTMNQTFLGQTGVDTSMAEPREESPAKPMILNVKNSNEGTANDRLIQSISMIKDILKSNMQLREEQMEATQAQDQIA